MRALGVALGGFILSVACLGCPLLTRRDDPPPDPATATTVTGTGAKNEAHVLRYPTETPLNNLPAVIGKDGTVARTFPPNGAQVSVLNKGTVVVKVGQYLSTGTLVMFDDATANDGTKLLGWIPPTSLDATAATPLKPFAPKAKDGGTTPTPTVPDAGGTPVSSTKDAGAPVAANRAVSVMPGPNNSCPTGYTLANSMCRIPCSTPTDCPRHVNCVLLGANRVCTSG